MSVRFGLLGLLHRAPSHGYELRAEFESLTGETWPLNIGQVYATLQRLERDGLVGSTEEDGAGDGGHDRRRYALTAAGERQLAAWFSTPAPRNAPPRDELVIKLVLSLTLPDADPQAVIDVQRAATMAGLQALTRARAAIDSDPAAALVADAAIFNAEAEIRWLDHCEATLPRLRKGDPAQ